VVLQTLSFLTSLSLSIYLDNVARLWISSKAFLSNTYRKRNSTSNSLGRLLFKHSVILHEKKMSDDLSDIRLSISRPMTKLWRLNFLAKSFRSLATSMSAWKSFDIRKELRMWDLGRWLCHLFQCWHHSFLSRLDKSHFIF